MQVVVEQTGSAVRNSLPLSQIPVEEIEVVAVEEIEVVAVEEIEVVAVEEIEVVAVEEIEVVAVEEIEVVAVESIEMPDSKPFELDPVSRDLLTTEYVNQLLEQLEQGDIVAQSECIVVELARCGESMQSSNASNISCSSSSPDITVEGPVGLGERAGVSDMRGGAKSLGEGTGSICAFELKGTAIITKNITLTNKNLNVITSTC